MKKCSCGGQLVRLSSDREQDLTKVAKWRCSDCKKKYTQRLRRSKQSEKIRAWWNQEKES